MLDTLIDEPALYGCIPGYTDEDYEQSEEQTETIITRNGEPIGQSSNQ